MTRPGRVVRAEPPHTIESVRRVHRRRRAGGRRVDDRFPGVQRPGAAGRPLAAVPRRDADTGRAQRQHGGQRAGRRRQRPAVVLARRGGGSARRGRPRRRSRGGRGTAVRCPGRAGRRRRGVATGRARRLRVADCAQEPVPGLAAADSSSTPRRGAPGPGSARSTRRRAVASRRACATRRGWPGPTRHVSIGERRVGRGRDDASRRGPGDASRSTAVRTRRLSHQPAAQVPGVVMGKFPPVSVRASPASPGIAVRVTRRRSPARRRNVLSLAAVVRVTGRDGCAASRRAPRRRHAP